VPAQRWLTYRADSELVDNNRPSATCHCLWCYTRERASVSAAACRQCFIYGTNEKQVRELHGQRQLKGSCTLQKSYCQPTDEAECKSDTDDDSPALTTTVRLIFD